jgi:hypothetical protein
MKICLKNDLSLPMAVVGLSAASRLLTRLRAEDTSAGRKLAGMTMSLLSACIFEIASHKKRVNIWKKNKSLSESMKTR